MDNINDTGNTNYTGNNNSSDNENGVVNGIDSINEENYRQYMPPTESAQGSAAEAAAGPAAERPAEGAPAQSVIPGTYVVTETRYNHTDTYTGGGDRYRYPAQDITRTGAASSVSTASAASSSSADSGKSKESGFRMKVPTLILVCIICSVLGAAVCLMGYRLVNKNNGSSGTVLNNTEATAGSSGKTTSLSETSGDGQQVNITVDSTVTSPATAVAKKVLPSIVGIRTEVTSTSSWYGTSVSAGEGSGVIFTADGYIITNFHVVSNAVTTTGEPNPNASISVYLYSDPETPIKATVIGYDQASDLAVIKIDKTGLTAIEIGDSDAVSVGDTAIAIGNPGGLQFMGSVSQGIISGLNRSIQVESSYKSLKLIQTDAAINPGNSGGALTDINGKLIGINSVKISVEGFEGMGFAIPVNDVVDICTDIIKNGNTKMAYLGIELNTQYSAEYLQRLGYPGGLLVKSVAAGSPAEKAGIEEEDIIVSFNGTEVTTAEELVALKNQCSAGDKVTIRIYRLTSSRFGRWTGEYYDVEVTLG
jgi:serine protease Do